MYLVADSLGSCMMIIKGNFWGFVVRSCRHSMAMLSEEAFHVIAYVSWVVSGIGLFADDGFCVSEGLGWMYSFMDLLYFNASISSCLGRYENASLMF